MYWHNLNVVGAALYERPGHERMDITSDLAHHPDVDPEFDNYPAAGEPARRVRYVAGLDIDVCGLVTAAEPADGACGWSETGER